jgi:hypothetical protein
MSRRLTLVALALVAGLTVLGMPTPSGATYVASSRNALSTVRASADWTPPTVALRSPGSPVKDTVTLTADAADGETGIASVVVQHLAPTGTSWVTICTATVAPYSCSWATKGGPDGTYALRAVATDGAGHTTTSTVVETTVANNTLVQLAHPGDVVKGSVPLSVSLFNAGTVSYTVRIEYVVSGATNGWKTLCTTTGTAPYTCSWSTTGYVSGTAYDLRAVATAGSTTSTSATVLDVLVDNVAPSTTMQDPGSPLRGTVTLAAATAVDNESGIAQVQLQWQRSGTSTWTTACTLTIDPYSCRFDTTQLTDATYAFRSVVTDAAGHVTASTPVGSRVVDNTVSAVSMEDPGAYLSGTVALNASASSSAGVTSVRIDVAPSGTTAWTTVCTDTAAPYSCSWSTGTVTDGLYDFRAVLVDGKGVSTTSATVAARRVDNNPLRGHDVQATNGGASAGRLDAGDVLRLTYTNQVNPASISGGWNGTAIPVTVRLRDGNLLGLGSRNDTLDVLRSGAAVNLGSVNLKSDYVKGGKTVQWNATMVASTATVNGATATVVTLTLSTVASGTGLRTVTGSATMVWSPSAGATDLSGRPSSTAPVTEPGALDRDF